MTSRISLAAFAIGAVIFAVTLYFIDVRLIASMGRRLGFALVLSLAASAVWHLARTWAWSWCFPAATRVRFLKLARVRLAAEAFSYLTLRGIAGEPLKVVLLADDIDPRIATAAVALERIAYMVGTTVIVGAGSLAAIALLPLSHNWFRVFRAFAIAAGVVTLLTAIVLAGRGTYLIALLERIDRAFGTSMARGRGGRFVGAVERHLLELVRGNPLRLAVLMTATLVAYASMAAEAWIILRAAGVSVSFTGALAVETFSRVASFASAFIPANLGALEASSLAAATAVGAAAAGAPLALARRLRGLFWAGLGLAIYPRVRLRQGSSETVRLRQGSGGTDGDDDGVGTPGGPILLYLPSDPGVRVSPFTRIAGLPIAERVLRSAFRAGYARVLVFADAAIAPGLVRLARGVRGNIHVVTNPITWQEPISAHAARSAVVAIGPGTVVSPSLLEDAARGQTPDAETPGSGPGGGITHFADVAAGRAWPVSGLLRLRAADASDIDGLASALRDRIAAAGDLPSGEDVANGHGRLVLRMVSEEDVALAERTIRRSSYKDTDNKLARFNRLTSLPISIALIRTPLTANQLSVALVAVGFYSAWLFSLGHYWTGVLGAFLSLAASVLDGCDGEIARLKYQESALGCWIETFGDYSYYIAIFVGLTIGAVTATGWHGFYWLGATAMAGTLISFALLIYLRSRITAGQPEKLHTIARERFRAESNWWTRIIWRLSFVATRSAMPYGIMALSLLGALPLVVVLAAIGANIYWISLVLKLRHLLADETETVAA
jgi:phosphatidylglycerophosphate synthase